MVLSGLLRTGDLIIDCIDVGIFNDRVKRFKYAVAKKGGADAIGEVVQRFKSTVELSLTVIVGVIGTEHANDYGTEGLTETKEYWKNKGVTVVGDTLEENNVRIYQVKEFKIAFLSYIQSGLITSGQENVSVYQRETAKEEIAYAKQNADFVIVWMHWSSINQSFASTNETELADELVELGADMIIGNHSNYVQQMEVKKNSEGKNVFVAYSLGNYLLNTNDTHTQVELILKVELRKSKEDGKVYLQQVDYVPIYAMDYGTTAKPRYEYLDLRTKLESYESIPTQEEEKVRYQQMKDALEWIEEVVVGG